MKLLCSLWKQENWARIIEWLELEACRVLSPKWGAVIHVIFLNFCKALGMAHIMSLSLYWRRGFEWTVVEKKWTGCLHPGSCSQWLSVQEEICDE